METFDVGNIVDVRNYGRAEVIDPLVTEPGARFHGRIRVKYQRDGKTYYARPETLRKTVQVKQRVLLCHSTTHYRTCAASVVNWGDAVLEVGSHEGECTWLLSRRCRYIVGVDKSPATVAAARRRYPELRFEEVDGFDVPALKALGPPDGSGFSVVLVDIGGIASLSTVAALVGLYYKEFPYNTKIVVKSVFLKRMVEDCLPYNTEKNNPWALLPRPDGGGGAGSGGRAAGDSSSGRTEPSGAQCSGRPGAETAQEEGAGEDDIADVEAGMGPAAGAEEGAQAALRGGRGRRRGRRGRGGAAAPAEGAGRGGRGRGRGRRTGKGSGGVEGDQEAGAAGACGDTGAHAGAEAEVDITPAGEGTQRPGDTGDGAGDMSASREP